MPPFTAISKSLLLVLSHPLRLWKRRSSSRAHYHITLLESSGRIQTLPQPYSTGVVQVTTEPGRVKLVFLLNDYHFSPGPIYLFTKVLTPHVKSLYGEPTLQVPMGLLTLTQLQLAFIDTDRSMIRLKASTQKQPI